MAERPRRMANALVVVLAVSVGVLLVSAAVGRWHPRLPRMLRSAQAAVIRVEVLNGCGESGVASRVSAFLRDGGFQVVEVRNADRSDYFATFVVARRQDAAAARAVSRYLGGAAVVRQAWGPELADVSVVIGSDRSRLRLGS